jgi:hypothetical protein
MLLRDNGEQVVVDYHGKDVWAGFDMLAEEVKAWNVYATFFSAALDGLVE